MRDEAEDGYGEEKLAGELAGLRAEVARLRETPLLRMNSSLWQIGALSLLRGLAFGLGSALGATLLVAVLVRFLGSIDFIPILGDWAQRLLEQIDAPR